MKNTGKWLEQLVADIEKTLLPEGFTIIPNEKIFDQDGVQLAEFDLIIEGDLGSTSIRWLIECRDRPSEGAAPGKWILELTGRRDIHLFDRVTAVSTTGFSPAAIEYAKGKNVDLRTVENLSFDSIEKWFGPTKIPFIQNFGKLIHADIRLDENTPKEILNEAITNFAKIDLKTAFLIHTETGNAITIYNAWQEILNKETSLFDGLKPNDESQKLELTVNYRNPNGRYKIETQFGAAHIVKIIYHAELSITVKEVSISQITQYTKTLEEKSVAQSVHFELEIGERKLDLAIHNFGENKQSMIIARQSTLK